MKFTVVKLITALVLGLLAAPLAAEAQGAGRMWRVGVLVTLPRPVPASPHAYNAFLQELRDLGYVEGHNVIIEWRHTEGNPERRRREAAALVEWKPDVVLTPNASHAAALHEVDANVPIVVAAGGALVGTGLVHSLARPGGNITGLQILQPEIGAKRLQILKELMPQLQRVALLHETPSGALAARFYTQLLADLDPAALSLSVRIRRFTVASDDDVGRVFADMKRDTEAVIVSSSPLMAALVRPRLAELAARYRLPTMHDFSSYVDAGGLVSYGAKLPDLYRRAARYVDRILKGAKPADMPVEQPSEFELVINLRIARALTLTVPPSLLLQANRVIE